MTLLLVGVGGALGSIARYLFSTFVHRLTPTLFPAGTFAVNVVGVLGGFTTFSSFAFETFELLRDGQFAWACLNVVGQVTAGLIGLWAGYVVTG